MINRVSIHPLDLIEIKEFCDKYPEAPYVMIEVDNSSGIGSIVKVSLPAVIAGDDVIVTKTIADESKW